MRQQPSLDIERRAACMAHEAAQAGFTHHAMTGDNDGYRICTAGLADSLRSGFQFGRQFTIAACLSAWNVNHGLPDFLLVRGSAWFERYGKLHRWVFKVAQQLLANSFGKSAGCALRLFSRVQKINAKQRMVITMYAEHTERDG